MNRKWEIVKSAILILLVAGSLALTVALWVQTPPISSLPPELAGEVDPTAEPSRRVFDVFHPIAAVLHDGDENHWGLSPGQRLTDVAEGLGTLMGFMRPGDLTTAPPEEVLAAMLAREREESLGVTLFMAGEIPLNLILDELGSELLSPEARVDRILVAVEDDRDLTILFGGREEWYRAEWELIAGLDSPLVEEGFQIPGADSFGGEAAAAWSLAHLLEDEVGSQGEAMMPLSQWRQIAIRPLLVIPEMDLTVDISTATPIEFAPSSFFPDFEGVRSYEGAEGERSYTDGFRTLRIDAGGYVRYSQTGGEIGGLPGEVDSLLDGLREARRFLGRVTPPGVDNLVLSSAESTVDGEAGESEKVFHFEFVEIVGGLPLRNPDRSVTVSVDQRGVSSALLCAWRPAKTIQNSRGITPLSALERVLSGWDEETSDDPPTLHRIDLIRYPAERLDDERVVRAAWAVDLGGEEPVLVDATTGEIVTAADNVGGG
ncbi:MAG: hypothetical protein R6U92_06395 [Bacillota bacterium]